MSTIRLVLGARAPVIADESMPAILSSANLCQSYFPGRGLPYSILVHCVVLSLLLFLRGAHFATARARPPLETRTEIVSSRTPRVVMYLPLIGNGSLAGGLPEKKATARRKRPAVASIPHTRGLAYPGPQPILSDPPDPTNQIQTVLQPALENPPILIPPLFLPNLVQMAEAQAAYQRTHPEPGNTPPAEVKQTAQSLPEPPAIPRPPDIQDQVTMANVVLPPMEVVPPTVEVPKLVLPPLVPPPPEPPDASPKKESQEPVRVAAPLKDAPLPTESITPGASHESAEQPKIKPLPKTAAGPAEPPAVKTASGTGSGPDQQDLLALTPVPSPMENPLKVPAGEMRGRFAIFPEPNLITPETDPGSKSETSPTPAEVRDNAEIAEAKEESVNTPAMTPAVIEVDLRDVKSREHSPGRTTSGAAGTDTGMGNSPVSGKKPFSGITIVGGSYDPGTAANPEPVVQAPRPLQTAYGMTVISTENSGGGLPYLGVFSQEQIYTVYLDMRRTESDSTPSWALEFALLGTDDPSSASRKESLGTEGLILPFPAVKEQPDLPAEVVRKHLRNVMLVYAVINTEGKMEQLSVKESPDAELNEPMLRALSKWIFRPARLNGAPVAVKALLGIPLWVPE